LAALLDPVPLSAVVQAGLRVELARPANLRYAAERLSTAGSTSAFAAWVEYARHVTATSAPQDRQGLARPAGEENAAMLLKLRRAALGDNGALAGMQPDGSVLAGAARVAIIAGAAGSMRPSAAPVITSFVASALRGYKGVILCGGTAAGVPGIVGAVAREHGLSHRLVGYTPPGRADRSLYPLVRETPGAEEFSVREPLAMWADILQAGIPVDNVRVLAFPGNDIVTNEIGLARAMGAKVAYLDATGEALHTLDDLLPLGSWGILEMPQDPMTARAFLQWSHLPAELRELVARYLHNQYRRRARGRKAPTDPALAHWEDLLPSLKASNRAQADDIPNKLALIGWRISKAGQPLRISPAERLLLAEAEHGRWNIERLMTGWQLGDRQARRKWSPFLKPWSELDDTARAYDLEAVDDIGAALFEAGWGVVRGSSDMPLAGTSS
jgi:hypothetical protein